MNMKKLLLWLFSFMLMKAVDGDGGGDGGAEDRGDDFSPTDDDGAGGDDDGDGKNKDDGGKKDEKDEKENDKGKDKDDDKGKDKDGDEKDGDEKDKDGDEKGDKDGKDKGRKDTRIPVSRHKEILAKEREAREAAEKKLAQYQGGERLAVINEDIKQAEDKVIALDKEYTKLITDGEHAKAAEKMQEIRRLERDIADKKSDLKAAAASSQAVEKMRYDITVERLEAAYPVLNPEHDDHDPDTAQDVLDLAQTYRRRGHTPAEAIQKAAKKLLGTETKKQDDATSVKARVDKEEAEEKAAKEKEAERKKKQVEKNLEAGKQQPPDTSKVGADSDKAGGSLSAKDVMKMSQDDFNKLDEATLSRMRGDVIA